jgi:hypothetical protein
MPRLCAAVFAAAISASAAAPAQSADATVDDTARFLAGLPPASGSPLTALANDPVWQQHARYFDSIFAREDSTTLSKVRAFSREQLTDKHDIMLYMFSGPDFLYATSFFPSASTYVLAGLEPAGDIPPLLSLNHAAVDGSLRNLETSMGSLLSYSFFITKNMKTQLHEGPINGTLPVLFVFLARTGKTVQDVSFVSLDEHGNVQTDEPLATSVSTKRAFHGASHSAATGVRIVFTDGSGPKQTLYYFSTNLADGSFERSGFRAFLDKLGPADSFIKSASYLLHAGGFNQVRSFLLDHSATVLQDDSGIPVRYFDPRKWRLQAFGHYVGPLALFGRSYQPELAEVFQHAQPLDFGIGYRFRKNESNLLLAQKTAPRTSEQELTPDLPAGQYPDGITAKPKKKSRKATDSPQSRKKQADGGATGSLGCRVAGIFPFCSDPQPRAGH